MTWVVVILSLLGALLPSLGVFCVFRRARSDERARQAKVQERGHSEALEADVAALFAPLMAPNDRSRLAALDVAFVVSGFACTAAAVIISALGAQ